MMQSGSWYMLAAVLAMASMCFGPSTSDAAVVGLDCGSEFIKVALVKPGKPFHIVIDEHSKRKIPVQVAFDKERFFGNAATSLGVRKPEKSFPFPQWYLGRATNTDTAKRFQDMRFPHSLVSVESRGVAAVSVGDEVYSAEEMLGMSLEYVLNLVRKEAGGDVKDVVVTVPPFFSQKERRAMQDAAELAGLNVLALVDENTAAATQYGIDLDYTADTNSTVLFYNMGSSSTKVSVVNYNSYEKKEGRTNKTIGQFEVLGKGWDESLGGLSFDSLLVERWVKELQEAVNKQMKSNAEDITAVPRVMAKLRATARKTKEVLSANMECPVYIESAFKEVDFKTAINRGEFYDLAKPLFERVTKPIATALEAAKIDKSQVSQVIVIGGGSRIPQIQTIIKEYMEKEELSFTLNADEAPVMGAAFIAANISTQFRVRKLGMVDIQPIPIGVRFKSIPAYDYEAALFSAPKSDADEAASDASAADAGEGGDAASVAAVSPEAVALATDRNFSKRAPLFRRNAQLDGKRKTVAFGHTADFQVTVHYDKPSMLAPGVTATLESHNITGLSALMTNPKQSHLWANGTKPKVSLSFALDGSGVVSLRRAEATAKEEIEVEVAEKLKKNVTKMVPKKAKSETAAKTEATGKDKPTDKDAKTAASSDDDASKAADESGAADSTEKADSSAGDKADSADEEKTDASAEEMEEITEEITETIMVKKMKNVTRRFPLKITSAPFDIKYMSFAEIQAARKRLAALMTVDIAKRRAAEAKNKLESYIYATRSKLAEEDVQAVSTEDQRANVSAALEAAEDWLYELDDSQGYEIYADKQAALRDLSEPILERADEYSKRPETVESAKALLNYTRMVEEKLKSERPWVSETDRAELLAMVEEEEKWLNGKLEEQEATALHLPPVFTVDELNRRLRPLASRAKKLLAKKKPKPKVSTNSTATNSTVNATSSPDAETETATETADSTEGQGKEGQGKEEAKTDESQDSAGSGSSGASSEDADASNENPPKEEL